jgi:predicted RNA-binding Zn-ribbon protein involved in translation (DUF1610 family)
VPTTGRTPARVPAPLWRFGWRGWLAVTLGATLLIAKAAGHDPFIAVFAYAVTRYAENDVLLVLDAAYSSIGVSVDWFDLGSPEIETNLWIAASYAIALTIPDLRRRWIPITLITLIGIMCLISQKFPFLGLADWFDDRAAFVCNRVTYFTYSMLGLFVQLAVAVAWLRSPRLFTALAAMILLAALWQHGIHVEARRIGSPELSLAVGNWVWLALWYTLLLAWAFRERQRRTPIDPARCLGCGYELAGLREPTCPECGTEFIRTDNAAAQQPSL